MNKTEHLLVCFQEECAELQQAIGKALRFGLDDGHPDETTTNAQDIIKEWLDATAVMEMIVIDEGMLEIPTAEEVAKIITAKKEKVIQYMEYAMKKGTLECDCGESPVERREIRDAQ